MKVITIGIMPQDKERARAIAIARLAIFGFVTLQKRPGNVVRPIAEAIKYNILAGAASS